MTYLLDVSGVLALLWENHVHHSRVKKWQTDEQIAVCPISELGFLRIQPRPSTPQWTMHGNRSPRGSLSVSRILFHAMKRVLSGTRASTGAKTTDFYLANLADAHGIKLATLDQDIGHPATFVIPHLSKSGAPI
jgi:predicted nucleic acid-binding protein